MLSPVQLLAVATVVRMGSFADAARELGYTSSAISQQISQVERRLKVTLFERGPQRIQPTAAAELLAVRAVETLAMLNSLDADMRSVALGKRGRLRLGSFPTASERLVPSAIARYLPEHLEVQITLDEQEPVDLVPRLTSGELDLILVYWYDSVPFDWPDGLEAVDLLQEELVLVLPYRHPAFGRTDLLLGDLRNEAWVCTREGTAGSASLAALCRTAGFDPKIAFRSNDYGVVHQFVKSGLGVALVPSLSLTEDQLASAQRVVDVANRRNVQALQRMRNANPAVEGMVTALRSAAATLVGSRQYLVCD